MFLPTFLFGQNKNEPIFELPTFKAKNNFLVIGEYPNEKKYELQSKKMWKRFKLPIINIYTDISKEYTLVSKNPLTGKTIRTKIRKKNLNKIIRGYNANKKEIVLENLKGQKFYLIKKY